MNLARKIAMKVPLSLPMANVLKQDLRIERLKAVGFNMDDVVAAYGKEWLES